MGDVATVRVLGPNNHFGELSVLSSGARTGTVTALGSAETLSWSRDTVADLRRKVPSMERVFLDALIEEVRRLAGSLVDALYVPAESRVWRRLRELSAMYGRDNSAVITVTQDDLAQLAGTSRPTANRILQHGVERGLVHLTRGRIEVPDIRALERAAR
jgi:CRP-like cAMP-binding protein